METPFFVSYSMSFSQTYTPPNPTPEMVDARREALEKVIETTRPYGKFLESVLLRGVSSGVSKLTALDALAQAIGESKRFVNRHFQGQVTMEEGSYQELEDALGVSQWAQEVKAPIEPSRELSDSTASRLDQLEERMSALESRSSNSEPPNYSPEDVVRLEAFTGVKMSLRDGSVVFVDADGQVFRAMSS